MSYICPVCGYGELQDPPRMKSGAGSDEICPSCFFQFGYDDDACHISYEEWRDKWIKEGMIWDNGNTQPPKNWNPKAQLKNIGIVIS